MKRLVSALFLACIIVAPGGVAPRGPRTGVSWADPSERDLDAYGGFNRLTCTNKTGHFILTKVNNRWWFCTPAGHVFISMSVGAVAPATKGTFDCNHQSAYDLLVRKYGDVTYNWASHTLRRMAAWGFNSVGQDSVGVVTANANCRGCVWPGGTRLTRLPYISEDNPISYASVNVRGYARGKMKDIMNGVNGNYAAYRAMLPDVFDPNLDQWWRGELADRRMPNVVTNSPWILGVFTDDSDYFWGSGAGTDFPTYPSGHNNANIGYLAMIASPTQTYEQATQYGGKKVLYTDALVYSKASVTNPTSPCSVTSPCSLRDDLWQEYRGSISALNQAWGSNYTTFDSTGTAVKGEEIGTGDGTTKAFTHTLAHSPVSPNSLLILVGGSARAGDCAWFHRNCGASPKTGSIGSPDPGQIDQSSSKIDYATGAITVTFASPPASGTVVTADYIWGGWMAGGRGLMDESGSSRWIGNNNFCLEKGSSPYTVCVPGQDGAPSANPRTGADLDEWISQLSAYYFKTMRAGLARYSSIPYLGLDTIGSWSTPSSSYFLTGAKPYVGGAFVQLYADLPSAAQARAMYSYLTQYLGDVPLLDFITLVAEADSAESCHPGPSSLPTQQVRGQMYLDTVKTFLTTPSYNHDYPWVGFGWWAWQDFQNQNQGLVSIHDNAYDGRAATKAPGKDPWGFPTGGEDADFGDCLSAVRQANALWQNLSP